MPPTVEWDPVTYVKFGDYRDRPFFDLAQRIHAESPRLVVDLGCGPGSLTATLAERWPEAEVVGIDSSAAMLEKASVHAARLPNLRFELGDIASWMPGEADVVVSNAALQWVPGHETMLPVWLDAMAEGSWFAFQVPGNFGAPSHVLMRELADSPAWAVKLAGVLRHRDAVLEPADYLRIALDAGWQADAWETSYQQLLQGPDPVLEWVRGTGLRPVLGALSADDAAAFEADYSVKLREAYPSTPHGTVFPFRRLFTVARKGASGTVSGA